MSNKKIIDRLDNLIKLGEKVLETKSYDYSESCYIVASGLFQQWYTSSVALLYTFPEKYIYASEFGENCQKGNYGDVELGVAILRAAKEDIESGVLTELVDIISAEIFDDFLEMAEYLLENGYKDPTASLIGAVLENELRRMCRENDIPVKHDDNIGSLNQKLFQKSIYGKPQMRQISIWQSIRDSADHGKFEDYNAESVKNMLEGVRNFLASQLT
jgi:hypothetical protein